MAHPLAYILSWLAWLSTWAQHRGMDAIGVLICASPVVLVLAFTRARVDQWRLSRGYMGRPGTGYTYGNSEDYRWFHDRKRK